MRLRWSVWAATVGAFMPVFLLFGVGQLAGTSGRVFGWVCCVVAPPLGLVLVTPHDPLIWEDAAVLIPMLMGLNAVFYGLVGLLIGQLQIASARRREANKNEQP